MHSAAACGCFWVDVTPDSHARPGPGRSGEPELPPARRAHAVLDLPSRKWKAIKIERLLQLADRPSALRVLEIGTGSGGIAHYFGTHPSGRFLVDAVDVVDNRTVMDGYQYRNVTGTALPFQDESFDVVLSNHVVEHVGLEAEQRSHVGELRRVLKPGGVGYLAVPNRWMLVEPHYGLIFLSWLPRKWRSGYLLRSGKGSHYDCEPLETGELERLLTDNGLRHRNLCIEALRLTFEIERPGSIGTKALRFVPDWAIRPLRSIIPTLIYRFERAPNS